MAPKVQMLINISGTRNGEDYPPAGGILEVTDVEAKQFIEHGWAREPRDVETATAPTSGLTTASLAGPPAEPTVTEPPRSGDGSGKAAWHTYAKAINLTVAPDASAKDVQAAVDAFKAEQAS